MDGTILGKKYDIINGEGGGKLTPATADTLGGIMVGDGLSVTEEGVLSADGELPATAETLGVVKVGDGLSVTEDGELSADEQLPEEPAEDGVKVLTATTVAGVSTLSWEEPASAGVDYSTTEQNTGLKWIDGKDIYQKTFSTSNSFTIGVDWTSTGLEIADAEMIIGGKFIRYESHGIVSSCDYNLNSGVVRVNRIAQLSCTNGYAITAYYTKASVSE